MLRSTARVPNGAQLDTRKGRVQVLADGGTGGTAVGEFRNGIFRLARRKGALTELTLTGPLAGCDSSTSATVRGTGRRLWGDGQGRFRIRGRRSAALALDTEWLVEDRCDGSTLTRVRRGTVQVRDFGRDRTLRVRAGGAYVARR